MKESTARILETMQRDGVAVAEDVVRRQYEMDPGTWERFGERGRRLAVRDVGYHLPYLAEALRFDDPGIFVEYCDWLRTLFSNLGFPDDAAATTIRLMSKSVEARLEAGDADAVRRVTEAALRRLREPSVLLRSHLDPAAPLADLARQYLDRLLDGDRHTASRLVLEAAEGGTDVRDIYLEVFERTQKEIGRLWLTNRVSVAQEHFCTAATQLIMSQLYPRVFSTRRIGRTLIGTCVEGELHELGLRMVADFFEIEGWDTYYVGANAPDAAVVSAVRKSRPDVLAVSAAIPSHIGLVRDLVGAARSAAADTGLKVLVGGNAFLSHPDLWRETGADGFAGNAREAVSTAEELVA